MMIHPGPVGPGLFFQPVGNHISGSIVLLPSQLLFQKLRHPLV